MKKVLFLFVFLFSVLGAAAKVKRNIPYEKGVKNMKTDVENHTVTVTFDADVTNVANLQKGFAKFGYKAEVLQPAAPVKAQKK